MSFEITTVHGTVEELGSDLAAPPLHEREEFVVDEVKKAIYHVVTSIGGYLSVSCSGNINPVAGETGDVVQIYITSLPQPDSAPVETPITTAPGIETGEPTPVTEEAPQPQPVIPSDNAEPSLNPEGKTNEEIEKEAQENIAVSQQETAPSESVEEIPIEHGPSGPAVNAPEITPEPSLSEAAPGAVALQETHEPTESIKIEPPAASAPQGDPLAPSPDDA